MGIGIALIAGKILWSFGNSARRRFMAKRKGITAGELLAQLDADPEWVANRNARDARYAERGKRLAADEASLVSDLAAVGIAISSVYDFVGKQVAPDIALPILVRHLNVDHHPAIREGIIRALGIPTARQIAFGALCDAYCKERDRALRFAAANALSGMALFSEVVGLPGIQVFSRLFRSRRRPTPST